jgi:hypothetical protein
MIVYAEIVNKSEHERAPYFLQAALSTFGGQGAGHHGGVFGAVGVVLMQHPFERVLPAVLPRRVQSSDAGQGTSSCP